MIIRGPVGEEEISRLILAHVDDEDAFTEGENALRNVQKLIAHAVQLFSVTGAMTSIEKTKCFLWRWTCIDGKHVIQDCNENEDMLIDEKVIGRLDIASVVKTLGAHFDLQNNFTSQYE